MKAVIYARYSAGPRQTDQSIEGQLRVCRDYCDKKGLEVVGEYCDRHISGKRDDRPEFQRMIADAKRKLFNAVVVYKTDRFSRDKYHSAIYKTELKRNGIKIYYAAENIPDGPEGILVETIMEGLSEYYSAELAQKIRRGMHENALKAKSTGAGLPLGYKVDPETKRFQIDPDAAPVVRKIFKMYTDGTSCAEICAYMNGLGMRTVRGNPFNKNSINRIVTNRKYLGEYSYNGVVIPGGMPQIVSEEVFVMANAEYERRRARRKRPDPKSEYLLSGKLFCGRCKAAMVGVSGTGGSGQKWYYYYCPNNRPPKHSCEMQPLSRDALESHVARFIVNEVLDKATLENVARKVWELQGETVDYAEELKAIETRLQELKRLETRIYGQIGSSSEELAKRLFAKLEEIAEEQTSLEGERVRLKQEKALTLTEDQILYALMMFTEIQEYETLQDYHRRLLTMFVSQAYLYEDRILLFFNISSPDGTLRSEDLALIEKDPRRVVFDEGPYGGPFCVPVEQTVFALPYGIVFAFRLFQAPSTNQRKNATPINI